MRNIQPGKVQVRGTTKAPIVPGVQSAGRGENSNLLTAQGSETRPPPQEWKQLETRSFFMRYLSVDSVLPGLPMDIHSDCWRMPLAEENSRLTTRVREAERDRQGQRPQVPGVFQFVPLFLGSTSSSKIFTNSKHFKDNYRIRVILV